MSVFKSLKNYIKNHKINFILILFLVILTAFSSVIPAQILKYITDDVITNKNYDKLILVSFLFGGSYLLIGIITFFKDFILLKSSLSFTKALRMDMLKHIHKITYKELVNNNSGDFEAYFNNDALAVNDLFTSGIIELSTDLFKIIFILCSVFLFNVYFGLLVLLLLPIIILFTFFIRRGMKKAQLESKNLMGNVNGILLENIENIEAIKINKGYNYAYNNVSDILDKHFITNQKSNFYDAIFSPVMQMLRSIVVASIVLLSGYKNELFSMSCGVIIAGISLITDLLKPIEKMGMEIQTIQKSAAALKRIDNFFLLEVNPLANNNSSSYKIEFKNVYFKYDNDFVIKDFNLQINENDRIVLKGESGKGKSTLMKLALGLIKPTSGSVIIDDVEASTLSDDARKSLFSIVYQDPFFSNGTIYEEMTLRNNNISKEVVMNALKKVGLDYITNIDVKLIPANYSSGELALFNIARVIISDAKIIFLDEMNSKIDPYTSKKMIKLIDEIGKEKTIISINHYGDIINNAKIINL